eukprot:COSAG02_NODE_2566_length_8519_cov_3.109857_11_plen_66_part_00
MEVRVGGGGELWNLAVGVADRRSAIAYVGVEKHDLGLPIAQNCVRTFKNVAPRYIGISTYVVPRT